MLGKFAFDPVESRSVRIKAVLCFLMGQIFLSARWLQSSPFIRTFSKRGFSLGASRALLSGAGATNRSRRVGRFPWLAEKHHLGERRPPATGEPRPSGLLGFSKLAEK